MSDYIYSLESHLNAFQNRLVAELQRHAETASQNLYLAGGAMRDLLGGSPTRDLDFVLEAPPGQLAESATAALGGTLLSHDDQHKVYEMAFPGGLTAQLAMSRQANPPGKRPASPATIHEDLRRRDFTVNAIALKLNRGSKGLLIDPTNGIADLQNREIRTTHSLAFSSDPARLLRAVRLKHRLRFEMEPRTRRQFENAIADNLHASIPAPILLDELKRLGDEPSPADTLKELEASGLLSLYSPALAAGKWNYAAVAKLEKLKKSLPLGASGWTGGWRSFFIALTSELSAKERSDLVSAAGFSKEDRESCRKLQARAKKLEAALQSPNLRKASQIYETVAAAQPDEVLFVLHESGRRLVQDRLRNYIQKYLPLVQEIPDEEFAAAGKARAALIAAKLNARPKKVEEPYLEARGV